MHHPTKEIRGAKKFRHAGIEPSLKFKFDKIFPSVISTGQHAWAPLSGVIGGNEVDLVIFNVGVEGADLEKKNAGIQRRMSMRILKIVILEALRGCICQLVATQRVVAKEKKEST